MPRKKQPKLKPFKFPEPELYVWKQVSVKCWSIRSELMIVEVHAHIYMPGKLFVSCHAVGMDRVELQAVDFEEAKVEALQRVKGVVVNLNDQAIRLGLAKL